MSVDDLHFFTLCSGARLRVTPPAFVVIPMPSFSHAEQILLVVMHKFLHFILHVTCSFCSCHFRDHSRVYSVHSLLSSTFTAFSAPADSLSSVHCSDYLTYPCSCLFPFLDCVARVDTGVWMHARAFASRPCFDKSWSSFVACGQPKHAQIRHCRSRSCDGHDLRHALHSRVDF